MGIEGYLTVPVSAETLRLLMDAGIEGDELLRIVESIDREQKPAERSANAIRQARYRANNKAKAVTNNVTQDVTVSVTPRAHVEDNSSNLEISGKGNKKTARDHLAEFKAALHDLNDERLEAFVLLRKEKRGALTGYGAKLFRQDCADCGLSVAEGTDMAISRGWITVKAEYLKRSTGPPKKRGYADVAIDKFSGQANGSESVFGSHGDAQRISPGLIESRPDDAHLRGGIGGRFRPSDH
jgi:hypothetical protein